MPGSELITLFGDDLAEIGSARIGVRVVGGTKVGARELAQMLLAVGIADLLDRGVATLSERESKNLFRSRRTLVVQSSEASDGFTRALAKVAREPVQVDQLAAHLLGGRVAGPELALIGMAHGHLEDSGAVTRADGKAVRRVGTKLGLSPFDINDAGAEALRPEWQQLRERWEAWKAANAERADQLLEACKKSLGDAKQYDS